MIKVENNMLVLDASVSKSDYIAINQFIEIVKRQERERILKIITQKLGDASEDQRS